MPQTRTLRITFELDDPSPAVWTDPPPATVLEADHEAAVCALRDALTHARAQAAQREQERDGLIGQLGDVMTERDYYRNEHAPLAAEVSALLLRQFALLDTVARREREVEQVKAASEDSIAHVVGRLKAMAVALETYGDHAEGCHDLDAESCTCGYRDAQCLVGEPA